jgi:hypothetical protein
LGTPEIRSHSPEDTLHHDLAGLLAYSPLMKGEGLCGRRERRLPGLDPHCNEFISE